MGAYRAVEEVIFPGQSIHVPGGFQAAAGIHHQSQSLTGQAFQQLLPVGIEGMVVHMGMGVKKHFSFLHDGHDAAVQFHHSGILQRKVGVIGIAPKAFSC